MAINNIKDIIAFGFDLEKTFRGVSGVFQQMIDAKQLRLNINCATNLPDSEEIR